MTRAEKRGGAIVKVPLNEAADFIPDRVQEFLALNQALDSLALLSPRKAQVIELRYFGGLSLEETAEILDVSIATISREQRMAEAWLNHAMGGSPDSCEASLDLLAQAASGFEAVLASG